MGDAAGLGERWVVWRAVEDSKFEVAVSSDTDESVESAGVGIVQIDERQFDVLSKFRYSHPPVEDYLVNELVERGLDPTEARRAVDDARTYVPRDDSPTDLATIPRFLRWFENSYGKHTLAAMIHDELITEQPDRGALGSDSLSDRFFREMMRSSGVPFLRRWIIWSAVALRTRWVAGGLRMWSVVGWLVLSVVGISCAALAVGSLVFDLSWPTLTVALSWPNASTYWLLGVAVILIFVAAPLWGNQIGAGIVAAGVALWIVPPAIMAAVGWGVYLVAEHLVFRRLR
ncbi:DUF1353 domain-containing protein [Gordonia sp. LSe1-13]|uniref:DUF1353 domain-containing protein n=1 Tax=Gordonia sesuvii TaxID=3116777 RepID=A0ABU7MKI0_9ACTN|nr:DUF1353 domain-containing protein [Gordonia sp. LSe1-13]